jgi:hypothetical protein
MRTRLVVAGAALIGASAAFVAAKAQAPKAAAASMVVHKSPT